MPYEIPDGLDPSLFALAWMIGRWEGTGKGAYPGSDDFDFGQQIDFSDNGGNYLHYLSQMFEVDDQGVAVRPARPGDGDRSTAGRQQPRGRDVPSRRLCRGLYGKVTGAKIELATDAVVRTSSADDYSAGQRLYGNVDGDLLWTFDKAEGGNPLQSHLWARLRRV